VKEQFRDDILSLNLLDENSLWSSSLRCSTG